MSYEGHIDGNSLPYQFKIPSATTTQDGVMTKAQVQQLEALASSAEQLCLGAKITELSTIFIGEGGTTGDSINDGGVGPAQVILANATTYSKAIFGVNRALVFGESIAFQFMVSDDEGSNFSELAGATATFDFGDRGTGVISFPEAALFAGQRILLRAIGTGIADPISLTGTLA